ncbi:MAG: serine/threonine-protein kinase [Ktedonobacteraceae bacterium]
MLCIIIFVLLQSLLSLTAFAATARTVVPGYQIGPFGLPIAPSLAFVGIVALVILALIVLVIGLVFWRRKAAIHRQQEEVIQRADEVATLDAQRIRQEEQAQAQAHAQPAAQAHQTWEQWQQQNARLPVQSQPSAPATTLAPSAIPASYSPPTSPFQPVTIVPPLEHVSEKKEPVAEQVQSEPNEEEQASSMIGRYFGNYLIVRQLGEGAFARVYLGEHIHPGSQAAIKVLYGRLTQVEKENFRKEARTLVQLVHPNIVRILEFGSEEGQSPFLVIDYAPNGTLRQRYPKEKQLPLSLIASYIKQAADALQFAHEQKIIHRDVKPENMLLGRRSEVLLSDFGIATVAHSSRSLSLQDMAGTITYMAPEQIQSHPRPASDQYALGIVVYEWLSGNRPFQGSYAEIAIKHSVTPPPSLCQQAPGLSPAVEQVVFTALAKDPKDRFANVQAFATALEEAYRSSR